MAYQHLTYYERVEIQFLRNRGYSIRTIAQELGRSPSTISREIRRNQNKLGRYKALSAEYKTDERKHLKGRKPVLRCVQLRKEVERRLRQEHSPEEIAGRLPLEFPGTPDMRISHETIYKFVYAEKHNGSTLYRHLRQSRKQRRKRINTRKKRGMIKDVKRIDERPAIVERQGRIGDFEGDTVIGRRSDPPIFTLTDRKTLFGLAIKMQDKSAASLNTAAARAYALLPESKIKTMTVDNGKEFAAHTQLSKHTGISIYFARPYTATDRAINENMNGLLRQYFPKGSDFTKITQKDLNQAIEKLNNRPRRKLGYRTPNEVFFGLPVALKD